MKRIFIFVLVVLMGSASAPQVSVADENERQKLALELFELMNFDQLMTQTTQAVLQQMTTAVKQQHPNIEGLVLDKIVSITSEEFSKITPELKFHTGTLLVKYYSEQDLRNMRAFYKSETGQKALKYMPQMTAEIHQSFTPMLGQVMNSIKVRLAKEVDLQL